MENFNKIISFILGLLVVIVFLAIISGKINLKKIPSLTQKKAVSTSTNETKISPTPKIISSVQISQKETDYHSYQAKGGVPSSIPATGSPTILLPLFLFGLGGGFFLRKKT